MTITCDHDWDGDLHTYCPVCPMEEAVALAEVGYGHDLEEDPPMMGSVDRRTCRDCGRAVLSASGGTPYGSALTTYCTGASR